MKKFFPAVIFSILFSLVIPGVHAWAEEEESGAADLEAVYEDTAAFDGGDGSTINSSPADADAQAAGY